MNVIVKSFIENNIRLNLLLNKLLNKYLYIVKICHISIYDFNVYCFYQ